MLQRKPVFPHVIEMNFQAGQRLGCNVYLVFDGPEWLLIDVGFDETVDEIIELIRQLDFPLSHCKMLIATHADVDHIQGLAKINQVLKTKITGHPPGGRAAGHRRRDQDVRRDRRPGHPPGNAAGQARRAGRRRRHDSSRQARAGSLAHARPHRQPALVSPGRAAVQRRQHLSRRLRGRDRRPSRQRHSGVHHVAQAHSRQRRRNGCCPATARSSARTMPCSTGRSPGWRAICTWPTSAPAPSTGR